VTEEQAKRLFESDFWKNMDVKHIALFQIFEDRLCMPFAIFHQSVEKTVGHPVWTHEFARPERLRNEVIEALRGGGDG
jgi:hypothetical protein